MKTIQMTIDDDLLVQVDAAVDELGTSRSAFIREALSAALKMVKLRQMERKHAAGYARLPVQPGEFDTWTDEQAWGDT